MAALIALMLREGRVAALIELMLKEGEGGGKTNIRAHAWKFSAHNLIKFY